MDGMFFRESISHNIDEKYCNILLNALDQIGVIKQLKKGEEIIKTRSQCDYLFYVQEGGIKSCRIINNRECVMGFALKGDIECNFSGLVHNDVSECIIKAVASSCVLICKWSDLKRVLAQDKYLLVLNHFMMIYIKVLQSRMIATLASTAEDRYKSMIVNQSDKISQIPVSDLAAYLGVTKQSLSRIRRAKFKV